MSVPLEPTEPHSVLAFDFGRRRIGLAVGNGLTRSAQSLETIEQANAAERWRQIGAFIDEWRPALLVVGRPVHPDGASHDLTHASERFARQLAGRFRLPVTLIDERYSSQEARVEQRVEAERWRASSRKSAARRDAGIDSLAAAIILRQYWNTVPTPPSAAATDHDDRPGT